MYDLINVAESNNPYGDYGLDALGAAFDWFAPTIPGEGVRAWCWCRDDGGHDGIQIRAYGDGLQSTITAFIDADGAAAVKALADKVTEHLEMTGDMNPEAPFVRRVVGLLQRSVNANSDVMWHGTTGWWITVPILEHRQSDAAGNPYQHVRKVVAYVKYSDEDGPAWWFETHLTDERGAWLNDLTDPVLLDADGATQPDELAALITGEAMTTTVHLAAHQWWVEPKDVARRAVREIAGWLNETGNPIPIAFGHDLTNCCGDGGCVRRTLQDLADGNQFLIDAADQLGVNYTKVTTEFHDAVIRVIDRILAHGWTAGYVNIEDPDPETLGS